MGNDKEVSQESRYKARIEELEAKNEALQKDVAQASKIIKDQAKELKLAEKANASATTGSATGSLKDGRRVTVHRNIFYKERNLTPAEVIKDEDLLKRLVTTESKAITLHD